MGGAKKTKTQLPPDPDPTPMAAADSAKDAQAASREERKKAVKTYGRQKTILAAANSPEGSKTNILGG